MNTEQLEAIRERFRQGDYAISDHAIIEARKDGIAPQTITKLEWVAIHGKVIEEYPERERILLYAELEEEHVPVHIIVEYSFPDEPVIVTAYVPDSQYWIKSQIRKQPKKRKK
jgi:hypothetical protein